MALPPKYPRWPVLDVGLMPSFLFQRPESPCGLLGNHPGSYTTIERFLGGKAKKVSIAQVDGRLLKPSALADLYNVAAKNPGFGPRAFETFTTIQTVPKLDDETTADLRKTVLEVWSGAFRSTYCWMMWSEPTRFVIEVSVDYEDGSQASLVTDGWHVQLYDREGKVSFLRLWPAAQ